MRLIKRYLPLAANLASGIIFGITMPFIKSGMRVVEYDAVKFLAFRYVTGFLVMSLFLLAGIFKANFRAKPVYLLLFCGLLNPLTSQVLETTATIYSPTSQIGLFYSLFPVLIVLLSIPINRELPTRRQVFFMIISVSGILLINLIGGQMKGGTTFGLILVLIATLVISVQRVFVRRASAYFSAFETIYIATGMGAVVFSMATVLKYTAQGRLNSIFIGLWTPYFVIPVLYMGIFSCVLGFLCLTYAAGRLPIAVSSSTSIFNSVVVVLVGIFFLKEIFRPIDIIGTIITFSGIIGMSFSYNAKASNRFVKE